MEQGKDDFTKVIDELENDYSNRMDDITRKMNESIAELNQAEEAWTVGQNTISAKMRADSSEPSDSFWISPAAKSQEMQTRVQELTDQMAELDEAHQKSMEAARANLERQMGLFEDLDKSADISINDMIESLKKQEEATNSYAENIQKAMGTPPPALPSVARFPPGRR